MIKLFGICLVVVSGGLIGHLRSSKLKDRTRELKMLKSMLVQMKLLLEYNAPTVDELLNALSESTEYSQFVKELSASGLTESLSNSKVFNSLSIIKTDKDIISDVFSALGTTDLATQLEMLRFNISRIESALAEAAFEEKQKYRLYNSVGFMGGVLVALLII